MLKIERSPCRMTWQVVYMAKGSKTIIKACRFRKEAEALVKSLKEKFGGIVS